MVSTIMLCYNQAHFVVECLEGIKAQNYPNMELIVNDDASTDDSVSVIKRWLAKHGTFATRLLHSRVNQGICRSMNNALAVARGKYVAGIAADDAWLPGKLLQQVELFEKLPGRVGVLYSDTQLIDERGKLLPETFLESGNRKGCLLNVPQGNVQAALWRTNFIAPMTTLVRRECYTCVGPFDESLFAEDWDMWLRISGQYEFVYSPEISAKYRMVGTSASNGQFSRLIDDMCRTCLKHLRNGQMEPEARRAAIARLHALASTSYQQKSPRHKRNLLQAMRYAPSFGMGGRLLLACSGVNADTCERFRSLLKLEW